MSAHLNQRKVGRVCIETITNEGTVRFCLPPMLDALLEKNIVKKFRRKSGWVTVGVDPVRTKCVPEDFQLFDDYERRDSY